MPTIPTKIRQAIAARVATLNLAGYEIVWTDGPLPKKPNGQEETSYTPDLTKAYLRVTYTPNMASREGRVDSRLEASRMGVLQIDVFGIKTQGLAKALEAAGIVAEHFPLDMNMAFQGVRVRVMEPPSVMGSFIDTHIQVPVIVQTQTYA